MQTKYFSKKFYKIYIAIESIKSIYRKYFIMKYVLRQPISSIYVIRKVHIANNSQFYRKYLTAKVYIAKYHTLFRIYIDYLLF